MNTNYKLLNSVAHFQEYLNFKYVSYLTEDNEHRYCIFFLNYLIEEGLVGESHLDLVNYFLYDKVYKILTRENDVPVIFFDHTYKELVEGKISHADEEPGYLMVEHYDAVGSQHISKVLILDLCPTRLIKAEL